MYGIVNNTQAHHYDQKFIFLLYWNQKQQARMKAARSESLETNQIKSPSSALHSYGQRDSVALQHSVLWHFRQDSWALPPHHYFYRVVSPL